MSEYTQKKSRKAGCDEGGLEVDQRLKAERIQLESRAASATAPLRPDRVRAALGRQPGWRLAADERRVERVFTFETMTQASIYVALAAQIAHDRERDLELKLDGRTVRVSIHTPGTAGVTAGDLDLASRVSLTA